MGSETPSIWSTRRDSDGRRHAEEPGHDLGVEHGGGDGTARGHEHVEVLRRRVGHRDARALEDPGQRRRVDGQRVDERHLVGPGDLDEREVGDVGPLGVELGVEAVVLLGADLVHQHRQARCVDDEVHRRSASVTGAPSPGPGSGAVVMASGRGQEVQGLRRG